jgi:3-oxoacyl-[acyl-carrier-protein] synthase III
MNATASKFPAVFLDALTYELGQLRDIEHIPELIEDPAMLEVYRVRGLGTFAESSLTPRELGTRVAARTLSEAGIAPSEIDLVLYATDHLTTEQLYGRPEMNHLLSDLGLSTASALGIALGGCANFGSAIQVAASLIRTGEARNVLLLIVEKLHGPGSRLMDLGMSVLSDAAVACVISARPGAYEVLRVGRSSAPAVDQISLERNSREFFAATAQGVKRAVDDALAPFGMGRGDVARLFTNNYVTHIQKAFVQHAGFKLEQCFLDNVVRFAHAFSADTLINLADSERARPMVSGERVLLLGTAPSTWAAVLLEARRA